MKRSKLIFASAVLSTSIASGGIAPKYENESNINFSSDSIKLIEVLVFSGMYDPENAIYFVESINEDNTKRLLKIMEMQQLSAKDERVSFVY